MYIDYLRKFRKNRIHIDVVDKRGGGVKYICSLIFFNVFEKEKTFFIYFFFTITSRVPLRLITNVDALLFSQYGNKITLYTTLYYPTLYYLFYFLPCSPLLRQVPCSELVLISKVEFATKKQWMPTPKTKPAMVPKHRSTEANMEKKIYIYLEKTHYIIQSDLFKTRMDFRWNTQRTWKTLVGSLTSSIRGH